MVKSKGASSSKPKVELVPASCNLQAVLHVRHFDSSVAILIEALSNHILVTPLTLATDDVPIDYLRLAYESATYVKDGDQITFKLVNGRIGFITKADFLKSIGFPPVSDAFEFDHPTQATIFDAIEKLGLKEKLISTKDFKKGKLPAVWSLLAHIIVRCLSGKTGGTDTLSLQFLEVMYGIVTGAAIDYGTILWNDFKRYVHKKANEIPHPRFWTLCIADTYGRMSVVMEDSLDPFITGKLKRFSIPDQTDFGPPQRLPECLLKLVAKDSPVLEKHIAETAGGPSDGPKKKKKKSHKKRKDENFPKPPPKRQSQAPSDSHQSGEVKRPSAGSQKNPSIHSPPHEGGVSHTGEKPKDTVPPSQKGVDLNSSKLPQLDILSGKHHLIP